MITNYLPKSITQKSEGYVEVDKQSVIVYLDFSTDIKVTYKLSNGSISVVSSDTDICAVSINGNVVTVTGINEGNANVVITVAGDETYNNASTVIAIEVEEVPVLSDATPAQIQDIIKNGIASSIWNIGDCTAPIIISASVNLPNFTPPSEGVCAYIIGLDHNSEIEGTGIHFQFGKSITGTNIAFADSICGDYSRAGTWFNMNNNNSNSNGWKSSSMRNTICATFLTMLPSEWQNIIVKTSKYSDNTGGGSDTASYVTLTLDKIFLLSEYEVFGVKTYSNSAEKNYQKQYDYYKNGNSKAKYKSTEISTGCNWWLRSVRSNDTVSFCNVYVHEEDGSANANGAMYSHGFAPGFRVA